MLALRWNWKYKIKLKYDPCLQEAEGPVREVGVKSRQVKGSVISAVREGILWLVPGWHWRACGPLTCLKCEDLPAWIYFRCTNHLGYTLSFRYWQAEVSPGRELNRVVSWHIFRMGQFGCVVREGSLPASCLAEIWRMRICPANCWARSILGSGEAEQRPGDSEMLRTFEKKKEAPGAGL